ncbi:hypothetical protein EDB92DRAFT_1814555 [Lactarius akahatsu]|uniref:Uncharacterized protein n=1 Tax=Lactarius akahatsu TaxID=416441 RepID=A0AAD4QFI6_9AGAM|nr:hypothetical protein EDB92DRAFT_1814555 [Lactarius akahatsu]
MSPTFSHAPSLASLTPSSCSSPVPLKLALPNELPISHPLSPFVLSALTLPNERPIVTSTPLINLLNSEDDNAFLTAHPLLSPSSRSHVEDDTTLNRGIKTSDTSVSTSSTGTSRTHTPHYPPLFLSHAFEKLRDPDEVEPTTPQSDNPAPHIAVIPSNHPLYPYTLAKREQEYEADDESPCKRPLKQLAIRTTPLPKFKRYQPMVQKYIPKRNRQMPSHYLKPGEKPKTTDSAELSAFNAVLQHVFYRYRSTAKNLEYLINPFKTDPLSAVQGFWKKYHAINMPNKDSV